MCNALEQSKVSKLEELLIYNNDIGADGAKAVAAFCAVSSSLTRLDVSSNYLDEFEGGQGVKILRDAVSGRKGFVLIDEDND